mmetsp:Transcript_56528/g.64554  ORF Transcript_56528/g.64554 Transcript_56528/m.64554 type:complete len:270 (-) Transcript_56528:1-810(-)
MRASKSFLLIFLCHYATTLAFSCGEFASYPGAAYTTTDPVEIRSPHSYCSYLDVHQSYTWENDDVQSIWINFDDQCHLEEGDWLEIIFIPHEDDRKISKIFEGTDFEGFLVPTNTFQLNFHSDTAITFWGFAFIADPSRCGQFRQVTDIIYHDFETALIESPHRYCNDLDVQKTYTFDSTTNTEMIQIAFDSKTFLEVGWDYLVIQYTDKNGNLAETTINGGPPEDIVVYSNSFSIHFTSDLTGSYYGYKLTATPLHGVGETELEEAFV